MEIKTKTFPVCEESDRGITETLDTIKQWALTEEGLRKEVVKSIQKRKKWCLLHKEETTGKQMCSNGRRQKVTDVEEFEKVTHRFGVNGKNNHWARPNACYKDDKLVIVVRYLQ